MRKSVRKRESVWALDTGIFVPQLIPFSPGASRAAAKIDWSWEPPSISINGETPLSPKWVNMGKWLELWRRAGCQCSHIAQQGNGLARDEGFRPDYVLLGVLLFLQGQSLKCLIKLSKSKCCTWKQTLWSQKRCLCTDKADDQRRGSSH